MSEEGNSQNSQETVLVLENDKGDIAATTSDGKQAADHVKIPLKKTEFILVFVSLALAIFLISIDTTIVSTAIPAIAQEFQALDQVSWIGTGFFLTSTAFSPTYGSLSDILGRKLTFMIAITFFEVGSLICGIAPSMFTLILGRLIAGVGSGGILALVMIIIADIVSFRDRGKYQGIIGAVFGLSSVIGPLIGGAFTDTISWRWCFLINLPIGGITIFVIMYYLKFPAPEGSMYEKLHKIDYLGTFFITGATTCFLLPLQYGGIQWPWNGAKVISLFCAAAVLLMIFVVIELYVAKNPIIPARMFENRSVPLLLVVAACLGAIFFSITYYVPTYFQLVDGDTATQSGLDSIPLIFGVVVLSISSGIIISKTGRYKPFIMLGPLVIIVGQALLSTLRDGTSRVAAIFYLLITGIGIGSVIQCRILGIQASVKSENIAVATATSNFMLNLGGTLGVALGGTVFTNKLQSILGPQLASVVADSPQDIRNLPNSQAIIDAISVSLGFVYYITIPIAALVFLCGISVQEFRFERKKNEQQADELKADEEAPEGNEEVAKDV